MVSCHLNYALTQARQVDSFPGRKRQQKESQKLLPSKRHEFWPGYHLGICLVSMI